MSSPPAGGRDGGTAGPEPNWYPDPSIPGYIRYWDGAAWMPGTSRPEPGEGEPAPTPPHGSPVVGGDVSPDPGADAASAGVPSADAPGDVPSATDVPSAAEELAPAHERAAGASDAPATADAPSPTDGDESVPSHAAEKEGVAPGSAGEPRAGDRPVPRQADAPPVLPELRSRATADAPSWTPDEDVSSSPATAQRGPSTPAGQLDPRTPFRREDGAASAPAVERQTRQPDDTIGIRRVPGGDPASPSDPARQEGVGGASSPPSVPADGTPPRSPSAPPRDQSAVPEAAAPVVPPQSDGTAPPAPASGGVPDAAGHVPGGAAAAAGHGAHVPPQGSSPHDAGPTAPPASPSVGTPQPPGHPGYGSPTGTPQSPAHPGYGAPTAPGQPPAHPGYGSPMPAHPGYGSPMGPGHPSAHPGYGSPMPPRQGPGQPAHASPAYPLVGAESPHAAPEDGVLGAPRMSPLTESPLARSARPPWETDGGQQYPAGRPRRLLARFLDTLLPLAAAAAVGFLLFDSARDHVQGRVDEVEYAGVDQTVWLVDGTTGVYLAAVIGTFLVLGLLLEALPTALWGRTPGKILCGLRVVDLESQQKPSFGAALVRWLTHGLMAVMVVGVINVLWCLWDRPWRQCLHDKVAGTYVTASTQKGAEGTGSSSWS